MILPERNSLRDIIENISAQAHRLYHLARVKLSRSHLSCINDGKPYVLYAALFGKLWSRCQSVVPRQTNKCLIQLPRIGYRDAETGKRYVFLSNNFKLSAKTIADIYNTRWQVEFFFKGIKQNLKIKSFVDTSRNAVMTQIWIALCVYLLLAFIKFQST